MGGGNKAAAEQQQQQVQQPNPAYTGQRRQFGAGDANLLAQQLAQGGLGGVVNPMQFQQTSVPIINRPSEVESLLASLGIDPATAVPAATANPTRNGEGVPIQAPQQQNKFMDVYDG